MKEREENEERLELAIRAFTEKLKWRPNYESWVEGRIWQEHRQEPALWNLNHFVPSLKSSIIVEIGSGMGGLLIRLQREKLKALGVEYNPEYCDITKYRAERYGMSPSVTAARAEQLPLRDRCVDVVLCYEVIEHVFDPDVMLREIRRTLKEDGKVFLSIPNRWSLYDFHYHLWGIGFLPRSVADRFVGWIGRAKPFTDAGQQKLSEMHYYSWRGLVSSCRDHGFVVSDIIEYKLQRNVGFPEPRTVYAPVLSLLRRLRLLTPLYRVYRYSVMGGFHVLLSPSPDGERTGS